jgi:undecaprenyl pyrophosphate phosphatase UppP
MKNAPNSVIYSVTAVFVVIIAAFVVLAVTGSSSDDFRSFLNTVLNIGSVVLSGGAVVAAGAAAKSSANAETQTNGAMSERIAEGVRQALAARDSGNPPDAG